MAEGFWAVMGQRLLFWSGWFFTVFGVVVGLYLSKEYSWIGVLIALGGLIPLGTHSWWVHQQIEALRKRHDDELTVAQNKTPMKNIDVNKPNRGWQRCLRQL